MIGALLKHIFTPLRFIYAEILRTILNNITYNKQQEVRSSRVVVAIFPRPVVLLVLLIIPLVLVLACCIFKRDKEERGKLGNPKSFS